jgi:hypothetical protein
MSTLEMKRTKLFSWQFDVLQNGAPAGRLEGSGSSETGVFTIGDSRFDVSCNGSFCLTANGVPLAHAEKPRLLTRSYSVTYNGRTYTLKHPSLISSKYVLMENEQVLGTVSPKGFFKRGAVIENANELPAPFMLFLGWIALILWKRLHEGSSAEVNATAAGM